jgi:general secretion pathway protein A
MYLSFFNLKFKPFDLVPNPDFMFLSKTHKKAMIYLDHGISERVGFILLTGEVGSGKTTIIRELIARHLENAVLAKIFNTNVTSEQLIAMINDDFDLPIQGKDKISLLRDLNNFLVEQYAKGNRPLIIIDEAQNLTMEALEEIRMLSNLETSDSKLMQIILVGQPELREILAKPELRQLRQRISIQCHLHPLDCQEIEEYILHRLQVAGNRDALSFAPEAIDIIYKYSCGIPRLINIICDFLLLSAFAEEIHDISKEMICDIVGDLDFSKHYWADNQDRLVPVSDVNISGANTTTSEVDKRVEILLEDMNRRLDQFEEESLSATQALIRMFSERMDQIQNNFSFHLNKINSAVVKLSRKTEVLLCDEIKT